MRKPKGAEDFTDMPPRKFLEGAAQGGVNVARMVQAKFGSAVTIDFEDFVEKATSRYGFIDINRNVPDFDNRVLREELLYLHRIGLWASTGLNVFSLSDALTAGFMLTEPPPLEDKRLHVPFPSFCIRIPAGMLPIYSGDRQYWVQMIWVHDYWGMEASTGGMGHFFRWCAMGHGVQVWLDRNGEDVLSDVNDVFRKVWDDDPEPVAQDIMTTEYALRIVRNFVAWLDAVGGLKSQKTSKPQAGGGSKGSKTEPPLPTVWMLGHEVKLSTEVKKMASEAALGKTKHALPGWHVRVRFVVRGHWRNQPHGEGRQERKRIWIQPFWKGPEGTAAWSHLYTEKQP